MRTPVIQEKLQLLLQGTLPLMSTYIYYQKIRRIARHQAPYLTKETASALGGKIKGFRQMQGIILGMMQRINF